MACVVQVQYKSDCEQFYGKVLDNSNVVSSVHGACRRNTEETWNSLYPEEPYALNLKRALSEDISDRISELENCNKYDLVSAVKRQSSFFYQVITNYGHSIFTIIMLMHISYLTMSEIMNLELMSASKWSFR